MTTYLEPETIDTIFETWEYFVNKRKGLRHLLDYGVEDETTHREVMYSLQETTTIMDRLEETFGHIIHDVVLRDASRARRGEIPF